MTDTILEIAAYVTLGIGVAVLLYRALGARVQRRFGLWRFDRKVRKLDGVPHQWVSEWASESRETRDSRDRGHRDHPSGDTLPPRDRRLSDDR
jgi:hypothetical protein